MDSPRAAEDEVRYWAMRRLSGAFEPHDEVDEIRWVAPAEAGVLLLSYSRDLPVLRSLPT